VSDIPRPQPLPAATILLLRDDPAFEVLMVKRHHQIDFASGALVFPGGKTAPGDHDPAWDERCTGFDACPEDQRALRIAAIREAYEESAILLARTADGAWAALDERAGAARDPVAKGERPFLDLVRELDVRLDLGALTRFARWVTPAMMPKRFDTWFYVAVAPEEQLAECDGWETVDAEWIAPGEALQLAEAGERKIIFPTRMNLQLLAESASAKAAMAAAAARPGVTVEPRVSRRESGDVLVIPPDAGYGAVEELLSAVS
jgi:8-oxo-dGTP pyrophosphatase MutT (NUDIX family)